MTQTPSPQSTTPPSMSEDGAPRVPAGTAAETDRPLQLLHLVFGGELETLAEVRFKDLSALHVVGIYPNYAEAQVAWKAHAQRTVDNAQMRYFVVHLHRLLEPDVAA